MDVRQAGGRLAGELSWQDEYSPFLSPPLLCHSKPLGRGECRLWGQVELCEKMAFVGTAVVRSVLRERRRVRDRADELTGELRLQGDLSPPLRERREGQRRGN